MVGNIAQIYSPYLYEKSMGPLYRPAMIANTMFVLATIIVATLLRFCLQWENRKLESAEQAQNADRDMDAKAGDEIIQSRLGGLVRLNPNFRYTL